MSLASWQLSTHDASRDQFMPDTTLLGPPSRESFAELINEFELSPTVTKVCKEVQSINVNETDHPRQRRFLGYFLDYAHL